MVSSPEGHRLRLAVLGVVIISIFSTLVARLWYLQFLNAPKVRGTVESNSTRTIFDPSPRGRLFDANGVVLADNRLSEAIVVDPQKLKDRDNTLNRLAALLSTAGKKLTPADLQRRIDDPRASPYVSRAVATDVPKDVVIQVREHPELFPGVTVETRMLRKYATGPAGALAPHLIGYLGEASPDDIKADPNLKPGDIVGRGGVEQEYQQLLRGEKGERRIEVDAQGRPVGDAPISNQPPERGYDLSLTVDAKVQSVTEQSLADGIAAARGLYDPNQLKDFLATGGAAIVMDADTGAIVAEASFPEFDLRAFNEGDDRKIQSYLDPKTSGQPLTDRAIDGVYPPGSTFKPVMASIGLEVSATAQSGERGSFPCGGSYIIPDDTSHTKFYDWITEPYGYLDLSQAIVHSCDIAFYTIGVRIENKQPGGTLVSSYARTFGLDHVTGIDLPNEAAGRIPDEKWKQRVHKENPDAFPNSDWYTGDAVNTSIGQGDVIVTPLQLATAYSAIINGGTVYKPHVLDAVVDPTTGAIVRRTMPEVAGHVPVRADYLSFVTRAMEGVLRGEGTGAAAFEGFPVDKYVVVGKTGTAETAGGNKQDTAWFTGFIGKGRPKYVVSVVVEEGGHGGSAAAPIARRIMSALVGESTEKVVLSSDSGDR